MILLVTSSRLGAESAACLEGALKETVTVADSVRRAGLLLREGEYSAVVLDEPLAESEPEGVESLLLHTGAAVPVYVNLAVSSAARVAREVRYALRRFQEARLIALRAAESLLRSEIRDAVTGILLGTQLALQTPELPDEAEAKLRSIGVLAAQIRSRLELVQ